mgnify:CR=1 FL=1
MATQQSATAADLTDELISAMPEGFSDLMDLADPDGPGPLFTALGAVIKQVGTDQVDDLRDQLSPLTCSTETLAIWEAGLGLLDTPLTRTESVEFRRVQVISRLREWGAPTRDLIRRVVFALLGYSNPEDVVILESDRAALRALHTYSWRGVRPEDTRITLQVKDGGKAGNGGAALDVGIIGDWTAATIKLTIPDGTTVQRAGAATTDAPAARTWALVTSGASTLNSAWGDGTNIWFVGNSGTILMWDGSTVQTEVSGVATNLNAVWGEGSAVYAVGASGVILKRSGGTWATITSPTGGVINGVFAAGGKVWICGNGGNLWRSDDGGTSWNAQTTGTAAALRAVWGPDSSNLWAVGATGTIIATTDGGGTWAAQSSGTTQTLNAVRGTSPWDVWVGGAGDTILHFSSLGVWTAVLGTAGQTYRGIAPSGLRQEAVAWPLSTQVWAVGTVQGAVCSADLARVDTVPSGTGVGLNALWAVGPNDVWGCGPGGAIVRMLDAGDATRVRLYFWEVEGVPLDGSWQVEVSGTGLLLTSADLFVEGTGLDGANGASGRGTAAAWWGVMFEESKSSGSHDLDAARRAVARLTMACRWTNILRRSSGAGALPSSQYGAIPGDPGALPGAAVPGVAV